VTDQEWLSELAAGLGVEAREVELAFTLVRSGRAERSSSARAPRRTKAAEKKALQERENLFHFWWRWCHERVEALLAGPPGGAAQTLLEFLQTMSLDQGPQLIELVRAGDWHRTDSDVRFEILSLINAAITALHEQHGLPPFDDALPDEEPTAFLVIREMFR
jgi:hypothetical protein